ncbi:OB-fold-containig protein [Acinetobacter lwoffii]|uniref:OB-fold-containig protein n=1 Tax=Acinetobacter lwoffii TaxID=28090 RepID=UPI003F8FFE26
MPAFFLDYNLMPFHLSLLAIILFGVVKTIGFYFGLRPSKFLQKISPYDFQQMDLLNVKFSKTLIVFFFLMNFSFAGYVLQFLIYSQEFKFLPAYYLIIPALIIATFFTIFMIHCLDQVIPPKYKKNNVNLLGRLATISSGNARPGFSAHARVRDEYGQLHYVQVEPEFGELGFQSQIILIRMRKSHYVAKKICKSNQLFSMNLD